MRKTIYVGLLSLAVLLTVQCKKDEVEQSNVNMDLLETRLPGDWNLIAVKYAGLAPNPYDSTKQYPFNGDGSEVSGFFKFTTDPNMLDFEMNWKGLVDFGGGTTITIPVTESGVGTWEVLKDKYQVVGDAWGTNPQNDTIPVVWNVQESSDTRQVWQSKQSFNWDGFDIPVLIDLRVTFVK